MSISRKRALGRMAKLAARVEEHLAKLAADPSNTSARHWAHEAANWLIQMEHMTPHVGEMTGRDWELRIAEGRERLGDFQYDE